MREQCLPNLENATCESFNEGFSDPTCEGQFVYDAGATSAFEACQDVGRAYAALVGLCGGDYDASFTQVLESLNCGTVAEIQDRATLYGVCIQAILGGDCEDTAAGFRDPGCEGQLLIP